MISFSGAAGGCVCVCPIAVGVSGTPWLLDPSAFCTALEPALSAVKVGGPLVTSVVSFLGSWARAVAVPVRLRHPAHRDGAEACPWPWLPVVPSVGWRCPVLGGRWRAVVPLSSSTFRGEEGCAVRALPPVSWGLHLPFLRVLWER